MTSITPRPLRQMVGEADLILVGRTVSDPRFPPTSRDSWRSELEAALEPIEILKASARPESPVRYSAADRSLELLRFTEGTEVLAFLQWKPCAWSVDPLSRGIIQIQGDSMRQAYSKRIRELVEIHELPRFDERRPAIMEWIVRCCESPLTRWEGAYEFSDDVQKEHFRSTTQVTGLLGALSPGQRERLLLASIDPDSMADDSSNPLLPIVAPLRDPRVAHRIEQVLRAMLHDPSPRPRPWMEPLVEILDWQEGRDILGGTSFPPALPATCVERLAHFLDRLDSFRGRPVEVL